MPKRSLRFAVFFVFALVIVPWLPLFVERTFMRSWRVDRLGDQIDWGWKLVSLREYWSDYRYMNHDQRPALWLTLDIGLAILYAVLFAVGVNWIFGRWEKTRHRRL